ncbi:MAG TPA: hypothetical protein VMR45_00710 [Patescibacteria group bacterium]|nr:hypothetical protein [Patescibacteria group bacterium]
MNKQNFGPSAPPHTGSEHLASYTLPPDVYGDMAWQASTNLRTPLAIDPRGAKWFAPEHIVRNGNDDPATASIVGYLVTHTIIDGHKFDTEQAAIIQPTIVPASTPNWLASTWRKALRLPAIEPQPQTVRLDVWSIVEAQ